jgi:hypothetical protein
VFDSQKDARNNEQGFAPGHKNVHFIREEPEQYQQQAYSSVPKAWTESKQENESDGKTRKIHLDPRVLDKVVFLGTGMYAEEEAELLAFLDKNNDAFAWSTSDRIGVSWDIIEYRLQVSLTAKPRKQKLCKMSEEKVAVVKAEVQWLLDASFIS